MQRHCGGGDRCAQGTEGRRVVEASVNGEGGVAGDGEGRCSQIKEDLGPMSGWVLMFSPVQGGMPVKYFEQRKWLGHVCFLERSVQCPQEDRCQGG